MNNAPAFCRGIFCAFSVRYNAEDMSPSETDAPVSGAAALPLPAPPHSVVAHWSPVLRFLLLNIGLALYGLSLSAMIRANVGLAPWDAFHVGLSKAFPLLSIGGASIMVGLVFQIVALLFLQMPVGIGSALNILMIGVYIDCFSPLLPSPTPGEGAAAWLLYLGGVLGTGLATGTYIASGFGAGPRDSLVIGLSRKTRWPVKYVRSGIEVGVLLMGWLLGAKIGGGTLVFALLIGPAMSAGMGLFRLKR